jgi:hypothetical protein
MIKQIASFVETLFGIALGPLGSRSLYKKFKNVFLTLTRLVMRYYYQTLCLANYLVPLFRIALRTPRVKVAVIKNRKMISCQFLELRMRYCNQSKVNSKLIWRLHFGLFLLSRWFCFTRQ